MTPTAAPPVAPPHRAVRAFVLTCSAVAVGAAAHHVGGGEVSLRGVAGVFPVLLALVWSLTDKERGWLPIAGAQLAGQQAVHAVLEWLAPHPTGAGMLPADLFLYGHVTAAVLLAAWLRHGERRAWVTARRAMRAVVAHLRVLAGLLGHGAPVHLPLLPAAAAPVPAPAGVLLRHAVVRRGPPLLV